MSFVAVAIQNHPPVINVVRDIAAFLARRNSTALATSSEPDAADRSVFVPTILT